MSTTWLICASAVILFTFTNTFNTVAAQRPSYAGSRPGGLNQRDKYHIPQNNNASTDIASRFGTPENIIPFGTAQRAPVGLPVVMPEGTYVPLQSAAVAGTDANALSFASRLGETNTQTVAGNASGSAQPQVPTVQPQPQAPTPALAPLPLDAQGDRELINQLSLLPEDKRPFWFLNYQAIEAQRNSSSGFNSGFVQSRGSFAG